MASSGEIARLETKVYKMESLPLVWTASGPSYVIEEVLAVLRDHETEAAQNAVILQNYIDPRPDRVRQNLGTVVRQKLLECYRAALPLGERFVSQEGKHKLATDLLFLGYSNDTAYFLEIAADGQMNWHTEHYFYAIGSGGPFASVAHALMRHYLAEGPLTLELGKRLAYRTIETTCEVSTSHVALPVRMAVVDSDGSKILSDGEIEELKTIVAGWKQIERETLGGETEIPASGEIDAIPEVDEPPTAES
jgi:hypothetical protein